MSEGKAFEELEHWLQVELSTAIHLRDVNYLEVRTTGRDRRKFYEWSVRANTLNEVLLRLRKPQEIR